MQFIGHCYVYNYEQLSKKTTISHGRLLNMHYHMKFMEFFFYVFNVNMMFHILKILLMISPFVSFQQNPFWHAKSFPWLLTLCWSTNDHCSIVLCATFFYCFYFLAYCCALFSFSRVEYNASHKSFKLTAYLLIKQTDRLAGVHGDQNITNICLKKQ